MSNRHFINIFFDRFLILLIHQFFFVLTIIILGKKLDTTIFGILSFSLFLIQIFFSLSEWGFYYYAFKKNLELNKANFIKESSDIISSKLFILCLIFLFLFLIKLFGLLELFDFKVMISLILTIFFAGINPHWFFHPLNQVSRLILPTFIGRILSVLVVILFANNTDIYWAVLSQAIAFSVVAIYGNFLLFFKYKVIIIFKLKKIFHLIKNTSAIFLTTVLQNQILSFWSIILIFQNKPIEAAYFYFADQILRAGNAFTNILPEILLLKKNKQNQSTNKQNLYASIFIISFFCILIYFFADKVLIFLFQEKFLNSFFVIQIATICIFIMALIKIYSYPILGLKKGYDKVNKISFYIFLLHSVAILFCFNIETLNSKSIIIVFMILLVVHFLSTIITILRK